MTGCSARVPSRASLHVLVVVVAALALLPCTARDAIAQNALVGKSLYKTWCQVCHTVQPNTAIAPFNQIMTAANNPAQITAAANVDPSQMGFITTSLTPANLQDIAAYLGTFVVAPTTADVVEYLGNEELLHVQAADQDIVAIVGSEHRVRPGDIVNLVLSLSKLHLFDAETGAALTSAGSPAAVA